MIRDVKQIEESTLWEDTGKQIANKYKQQSQNNLKKVVIVVGDRGVGKSSFLKTIKNDFDPQTKPNLLVEYIPSKIGRQKKTLVHFYEIGSLNLLPLLSTFHKKKDLDLTIVICVDLSKPKTIIASTTDLLNKLMKLTSGKSKVQQQIKTKHEDSDFILDMPLRVCLVGCKWDLFEKLDLQSRKWTSRSLRYLAHTHSASVLTCSNKNSALSLNLRSAFSEFFLEDAGSSSKNVKDINKPIFIKFGEDKIADMNLPTSGSMTNLQVLEKQLQSLISQPQKSKNQQNDQPEQIVQSKLDDYLNARRKELTKLIKLAVSERKAGESELV